MGAAGNETLDVVYNGTAITQFEGGSVTGIESVNANLGAGIDTLVYVAPSGVTVNLSTGTASGFTSISGIENVTAGSGIDHLTGNGNANVLSAAAEPTPSIWVLETITCSMSSSSA